MGLPCGSVVKNLPAIWEMQETWIWSLGQKDPLEARMATHSSILAWIIPWTEEPGRLWSIGLQRFGHDWSNLACTHDFMVVFWMLFLFCSHQIPEVQERLVDIPWHLDTLKKKRERESVVIWEHESEGDRKTEEKLKRKLGLGEGGGKEDAKHQPLGQKPLWGFIPSFWHNIPCSSSQTGLTYKYFHFSKDHHLDWPKQDLNLNCTRNVWETFSMFKNHQTLLESFGTIINESARMGARSSLHRKTRQVEMQFASCITSNKQSFISSCKI